MPVRRGAGCLIASRPLPLKRLRAPGWSGSASPRRSDQFRLFSARVRRSAPSAVMPAHSPMSKSANDDLELAGVTKHRHQSLHPSRVTCELKQARARIAHHRSFMVEEARDHLQAPPNFRPTPPTPRPPAGPHRAPPDGFPAEARPGPAGPPFSARERLTLIARAQVSKMLLAAVRAVL